MQKNQIISGVLFMAALNLWFLVQANSASALSYQVRTGADWFDPNWNMIENIIDNDSRSSVISLSDTSNLVFASSTLATGKLRVSAPSSAGAGRAGWTEELNIIGLSPASTTSIGIELRIDGTYSAPDGQAAFAFHALSSLTAPHLADLLMIGATYRTNQTNGSFSTESPDIFQQNSTSGDWTSIGTSFFAGQIDINSSDPTLRLVFDLTAVTHGDFSNTASIWLDLPEGITFQSASGVFLSEATPPVNPVPEPASIIIFGTGLAGLTAVRRRKSPC